MVAGLAFALSMLVVGTLLAQVVGPPAPAAAEPTPPAVGDDPSVPEIGSAAVEYAGPPPPAPTGQLGVVRLSTTTCGERRTGSGVVVADGLVLTAAHVVGDASLVRVDAGGAVATGEVLGVAIDGRDLALVEVDAVTPEPVRSSTALRVGEAVTLVGHPAGGPRAELVGRHLVPSAEVQRVAPAATIAVDVEVPTGMSGGPAIDPRGGLVGVISGTEVVTGTTFVVPVDPAVDTRPETMVDGTCPTAA